MTFTDGERDFLTGQDFAWLPLDSLKVWQKNPRHNEPAVEPVMASIERFGFVAPVVVWKEGGRMVAGHTRLKALERILTKNPSFLPKGAPGPGMIPVRFVPFASEAEADAYALADNRLAQIATWDEALLPEVMQSIKEEDATLLSIAGWEDEEIRRLLSKLGEDGGAGASREEASKTLAEEFLVPPFTVLNAREGTWQDRKRAWIGLGIQSELGRGDTLTWESPQIKDTNYYRHRKAKIRPGGGGGIWGHRGPSDYYDKPKKHGKDS